MPSQSARPPWILRLTESKTNYWATYVVDLSLMTFFLAWDYTRMRASGALVLGTFAFGVFVWTFIEYTFHRWMYHSGWSWTREGHQRHHDEPTAYVAMPWMVTPIVFFPIQILFVKLHLPGGSSVLAGVLGGFTAYSFTHHSLHHYKMPFAWLRHLQSQHRIHHAIPESNYGVTMRFWDRVFGTEFTKESSRIVRGDLSGIT